MKALRSLFAVPIYVLRLVVAVIGSSFHWLGYRVFPAISRGTMVHVYWPVVVAERVVAGKPRWQPRDLVIGVQPRTDADRKIADDHPDVIRSQCVCSDPACAAKTRPMYSWAPGAKQAQSSSSEAGLFEGVPEPMREQFLEHARKLVGYNELLADRDMLKNLVAINEKVIENERELLDQNKRVIEADARLIDDLKAVNAELESELKVRDERIADLSAKFSDLESKVRDLRAAHSPVAN